MAVGGAGAAGGGGGQRLSQQYSRGRHLHSDHAGTGHPLSELGQQADDPVELRRRSWRHDDAGGVQHQLAGEQRDDRTQGDAVRILRVFRARPGHGVGRVSLRAVRRAGAVAAPRALRGLPFRGHRQAVHRAIHHCRQLAVGGPGRAGRPVREPSRHDRAHGPAARRGHSAAVRGVRGPSRAIFWSSPPPARP